MRVGHDSAQNELVTAIIVLDAKYISILESTKRTKKQGNKSQRKNTMHVETIDPCWNLLYFTHKHTKSRCFLHKHTSTS
jgi:hypothetical protein